MIIRKMLETDLEQVMNVEQHSFPTPWPEEIFRQEITQNQHAHYFVVELNEEIIGYAGTWIVADDAQITNIAILPTFRGRKVGQQLFAHVLQYAMQMGVSHLSLEVRVSNVVAQKMYRKFGLVPGGIRKNYYTDNLEDALVMWVNL
ncbi:ribosomal protein S18-alanine N-acetyltransferase [Ornithinibacillus sp. 4-3]|uniref:[Ribosomal protein bS18]-alanine N-acetyltransferase n=1 Tax=Ornithinibacillus sp. 4-3 TaxID=3231488 RepID=A0AB39HPK4_9BACI